MIELLKNNTDTAFLEGDTVYFATIEMIRSSQDVTKNVHVV